MKKKIIVIAVILTLVVSLIIGGVSYYQADVMVFNYLENRLAQDKTPSDFGITYQEVTLNTTDGLKLSSWYIPSKNKAVVIDIHGYKANKSMDLNMAKVLSDHGYGVLMIDLRSHGHSEGEMISFGDKEMHDIDAAMKYLETCVDVDPEKIGIMGHSNGGAIAILYTAKNPRVRALIANCSYSSLDEEITTALKLFNVPGILASPILWFAERKAGFDAKEVAPVRHIASISPRPILIMQGGKIL